MYMCVYICVCVYIYIYIVSVELFPTQKCGSLLKINPRCYVENGMEGPTDSMNILTRMENPN